MKLVIPSNNLKERKYIIDIIFNEFLGLSYSLIIGDVQNYEIILENQNTIIIEDHFFNKFFKNLEYLKEENIPKSVEFGKNEFITEDDLPIIYGTNKLITNKQTTIVCGVDIFASSFFMLTRWEEYANSTRDEHDRFPACASLAYKNNFLQRPIVNEYIEMLWNMLKFLGYKQERKKRKYEMILTHDVDDVLLFRTYKDLIRRCGGDIVRRKNPILALKTFVDYVQTRLYIKNDPYNTFDYLMDLSEDNNLKSYFFFMARGQTKFDNRYKSDSKFVLNLIDKIKKRGHYIGIHSTYNSYNDFEQFKKEKEELEKNLHAEISFGRQHYLRFEIPTTWQIWEDNEMDWDSTVGYADRYGFRCGTGDKFSVFNILYRNKLNLKEIPLLCMDTTFLVNDYDLVDAISDIKSKTKRYKSSCVFLFHNSNIHYFSDYDRLIRCCFEK